MGLTPLQRSSRCILQLQPTGHQIDLSGNDFSSYTFVQKIKNPPKKCNSKIKLSRIPKPRGIRWTQTSWCAVKINQKPTIQPSNQSSWTYLKWIFYSSWFCRLIFTKHVIWSHIFAEVRHPIPDSCIADLVNETYWLYLYKYKTKNIKNKIKVAIISIKKN